MTPTRQYFESTPLHVSTTVTTSYRDGKQTMTLTVRVDDGISESPILEFELPQERVLKFVSNSHRMEVAGQLAAPQYRDHWGMKRWIEVVSVPAEVALIDGREIWRAQDAERVIGEWFRQQPAYSQVDVYEVTRVGDGSYRWQVRTITWIELDEYNARIAARELSEDIDEDEDGLDDDDDER